MKTRGIKFSDNFNLNRSQRQLDFVDVFVNKDIQLFISGWLISGDNTVLSNDIENSLQVFFKTLLGFIKKNNRKKGINLLSKLGEPKEIHLGYSSQSIYGKAVGPIKAEYLYEIFKNSKASQTGLLENITFSQVLVEGLGSDNVSDIIAAICRDLFALYTTLQCQKYNIKTFKTEIEYFDVNSLKWEKQLANLPHYDNGKIILVPKNYVAINRNYSLKYDQFVIRNKIAEEILSGRIPSKPMDGLINILKSNERKPILKNLYKKFGKSKNDLLSHVVKYGETSLIDFKNEIIKKFPPLDDNELIRYLNKFK